MPTSRYRCLEARRSRCRNTSDPTAQFTHPTAAESNSAARASSTPTSLSWIQEDRTVGMGRPPDYLHQSLYQNVPSAETTNPNDPNPNRSPPRCPGSIVLHRRPWTIMSKPLFVCLAVALTGLHRKRAKQGTSHRYNLPPKRPCRTPHGASRLVQANACLFGKTPTCFVPTY